ncbi:MAG: T9SS type A sorting domain-containing protein [Flavobacteriaceae bacterium]
MKKITFLILLITSFISYGQVVISPSTFEVNQSITITVDTNSNLTDCNGFSSPNKVYMHSGVATDNSGFNLKVIGNWGQDDGVGEMTSNGDGTYSITITPETYYGLTAPEAASVVTLGMVFRNENGSQEFKDNGCQDFIYNVGSFQLTLTAPTQSETYLTSGQSISIAATTSLAADFNLKANGASINTSTNSTSYSFSPTVTETTSFNLEATNGGETKTASFQAIVTPTVTQEAIPNGLIEGINYDTGDATKATLVLRAPNKDYIYVAGSFNNYSVNSNYLMKQDVTDTDLYWIEITGLTSGQVYTYQYWVFNDTPIADSPKLVKTADPYSTLVLSPFDDPGIPSTSYPDLPTYPSGQEREVTVLQTGQTPYSWVVDNFTKPKKEDLVIYEVLVRDFDAGRNIQSLIDRIDYFKNLNINAIELMPIMEYDGNESWGYNTAYHMALDKFYGTSTKLKEFVDLCHQNGIAVILDLALNHVTGRNPLVRMWMDDADDDGWGGPSTENPYLNTEAKHAFNVENDFNHQSTLTQNYTKRVVEHWITEFKIDGFRWDLTKGFTQNCTPNDVTCTGNPQPDRIAVLKDYADYSWSLDPTHYVIFEHLGQDSEEQEWANYRINDAIPKGVMMWGIMHNDYQEFMKGNTANISRATHSSRGFTAPRLIAYPESHDEERIMYSTITSGQSSVQNLNTALTRMSTIGATSLLIPGPKMIWHFGALGMNNSIWTCGNGSVQVGDDGCKLATKPQPQWTNNWLGDPNRSKLYSDWARLIDLKINEPVFEGTFTLEGTSRNIRMFFFDLSLPASSLKNVVVLANFNTSSQNIVPDFPFTGTWYNLIDNSSVNVTNTSDPITIPAGEFRIFGNQQSTLSTTENSINNSQIIMYPNPTKDRFQINQKTSEVIIYNALGKVVAKFEGDFQEGTFFDVHSLAKGIYFLRLKSNQGFNTLKLIKE